MQLHTEQFVKGLPDVSTELLLDCERIETKIDHIKALERQLWQARRTLYFKVKNSQQWDSDELFTMKVY